MPEQFSNALAVHGIASVKERIPSALPWIASLAASTAKTYVDHSRLTSLYSDLAFARARLGPGRPVQLCFCDGLRPGKLMALRWEDADRVNCMIQVQHDRVVKANQPQTCEVRRRGPARPRSCQYSQLSETWLSPNRNTGAR